MSSPWWNCYDYNGVIFVFGRIDSTVAVEWQSVTKVTMIVDGDSSLSYTAAIKDIPYTDTSHTNNTGRKVFNINTFTHRDHDSTPYQFSAGEHTCTLRFYFGTYSYEAQTVSVKVHSSLATPTISMDMDSGIINVGRSVTSNAPRYYVEIRRKDRTKVNPGISWQDKDYIHTVIMKGIEGGKYNEGIPHTGFMARSSKTIVAGSAGTPNIISETEIVMDEATSTGEDEIVLLSTSSGNPTVINCDEDIPYTSNATYQYYVFTVPESGMYHFMFTGSFNLEIYLYKSGTYSSYITYDYEVFYELSASQTIYIKTYDRYKTGETAILRANKMKTVSCSAFSPVSIQKHGSVVASYYANTSGYVTLYPAKKANGLRIRFNESNGEKTPYWVFSVTAGNTYTWYCSNFSESDIAFWVTNIHPEYDYQPYWRIRALKDFRVNVIFDNAEIKDEYEERCIALVEDSFSRLCSILSETSGAAITYSISNSGVSKLYVEKTISASERSSGYINSNNSISGSSSQNIYYVAVEAGAIYRISYEHGDLFYAKSTANGTSVTKVSDGSELMWYESYGYDWGFDINTLIVYSGAEGYYLMSNSSFTVEKVCGVSECLYAYYNKYSGSYTNTVRFGVDGSTWIGDTSVAGSALNGGGTSAEINGHGAWRQLSYYDSKYGIDWVMAIVNVDTSDIAETLSHAVHEELAQMLGIGDDCYSHEESIHWDPPYANPDWYTGIDRAILEFAYNSDKNGYTQFDLCNEYDLPITLFREISEYNSTSQSFQFRLKDASGNWLLRAGEYEAYAWCVTNGIAGGNIAGSATDGWDDDPYSLRTAPITFTIEGGWYWSDYGIDMKKGLVVKNVPYGVWNEFVDAVADVMGTGTIPNDSVNFGTAAGLSFAEGIKKAKASTDNKGLYAQRFNIVNYIICQKVDTGIGIQSSLVSQVLAEYMIKLQDCRNLM